MVSAHRDRPAAISRLRWRTGWLCIAWALVASVVALSLLPLSIPLPPAESDKTGHVMAYAALMYWFSQIYARRTERWIAAAGLLVLGCGLEWVQAYVGRQFEYADMLADATGIALGWLAAPPRTPHLLRRIEAWFAAKSA